MGNIKITVVVLDIIMERIAVIIIHPSKTVFSVWQYFRISCAILLSNPVAINPVAIPNPIIIKNSAVEPNPDNAVMGVTVFVMNNNKMIMMAVTDKWMISLIQRYAVNKNINIAFHPFVVNPSGAGTEK